jgi:dihydroorotate dehydrogenase electron transfer subunit
LVDCRAVAVENRRVCENLWHLVLELDRDCPEPHPGQFVLLRMGEATDPLLRRPFSVASFRAGAPATMGVLYAPVGRWTRFVASHKPGFELSVLGPLGSRFVPGDEDRSLLVGGGRGVAPLVYYAQKLAHAGRSFLPLVGARTAQDIYWGENLSCPGDVVLATEDGSAGARGLVTDLLEKELAGGDGRSAVYACGPLAMLKKVAELCSQLGAQCQVSVETVFGCGTGVCRGCSVPTTVEGETYLMACSDGPVLRATDVDWERFTE